MKPNELNWHFYNNKHRIQVIVAAVTFAQAKKRLRDMIPDVPFIFQFGEKP